jgi:hypothetical protein
LAPRWFSSKRLLAGREAVERFCIAAMPASIAAAIRALAVSGRKSAIHTTRVRSPSAIACTDAL